MKLVTFSQQIYKQRSGAIPDDGRILDLQAGYRHYRLTHIAQSQALLRETSGIGFD